MEMAQISSLVERLTDEQLMEEIQRPSGMAPLQVVMGEVQRRAALRGGKPRGYAEGGPVRSDRSRQIWEQLNGLFPGARFTGGTRTPERNAEVGGVPNSWHLRGEAVDFVAPGVTMADARSRIAQAGLPAGEFLRHNAGSGMHFHYSPEGQPLDGSPAPETPAPPPAPGLTGAGGFSNPQNITNNALNIGGDMAAAMGLPPQLGGIEDRYADISNMMPDATAPYAEVLQRLQGEEGRERGANRGRALMDAGLAMMSARTPNFMSALAAGGQAGLASRDRIQEEERGLMQSVIQAQLARSQAEQQQARASLEAASGLLRSDREGLTAAYGRGSELALGGARSQDQAAQAAAQESMQQREISARASEGALNRAATQAVAQLQIDAGRWDNKPPEERWQTAFQTAYTAASRAAAEEIPTRRPRADGQPGTELRRASEEEIIASARRVANAAMSGGQQPTQPAQTPGGAVDWSKYTRPAG